MKNLIWFFVLCGLFTFSACENGDDADEVDDVDTLAVVETEDELMEDQMDRNGIRVSPFTGYKEFSGVTLNLVSPKPGTKLNPGKMKFNYNVTNFELGKVTEDAEQMGIANSKDGQHLHVILNNEPYMAHYKPEFEHDMQAGNYVLLTFPSRSYHLSIKDRSAMVLEQFTVGNATGNTVDLTKPHLFYSRPKGDYNGADAQKILLDFYVVNTDLTDGHYVLAEVNGNEFKITKWQPYVMEGLPTGQNTIKLTLMDRNDQPVQSPYNPVTRTININAGQPTAEAHGH